MVAGLSKRRRAEDNVDEAIAVVKAHAEDLPSIDDAAAFGAMFDRFADARVILLGEATHGTSEFYRARAAITRRLIERHGFTIVAVEADWPDAARIDAYVRHRPIEPMDDDDVRALSLLDVAERGGRRFHQLDARAQRGSAEEDAPSSVVSMSTA